MSSNNAPLKQRLQGMMHALLAAFGIVKQYPVLLPLGIITLFAQMTYSGVNNVAIPFYIRSLPSIGLHEQGQIITVMTATFLLAETFLRVPFGWLSDRFGRSRVVIGAMVLSVPSILLGGMVPGYAWFFPLRGWDGMMAAALWPSVFAIIGDSVPERFRANAMGVINMMYMLALLIGAALATIAFQHTNNPRAFFFVGALLFAIGGVLALLFFQGRKQLGASHPEVHLEDAERAVVSVSRHLVLLTITFTQTFAITALAPLIVLYATGPVHEGNLGFKPQELGLLVGAPIVSIGLLALPLSRLSDLIGKRNTVRLAFTAIGAMLWIFAFYQSLAILVLTATVIGVAFSMGVPAWLAILSSLTGHKTRGVTLAGYGTVQGIASVVAPLVSGFVWDHYGHGRIFLVSAVAVSLAALLAWLFLPRAPRSPKTVQPV
ncbi:MAG: MFS transporter [Armatimonadota bacterium]